MSNQKDPAISLETAVARLVNLDYIPEGFSVLDMTQAFQEEAEVEYDNEAIDGLSDDKLLPLKLRVDACRARHALACTLLENIWKASDELEPATGGGNTSTDKPAIGLRELADWASDRFGIAVPTPARQAGTKVQWEDVTIKIYANWNIGWCKKGGSSDDHRSRKLD